MKRLKVVKETENDQGQTCWSSGVGVVGGADGDVRLVGVMRVVVLVLTRC
jgi:hypothetical protein